MLQSTSQFEDIQLKCSSLLANGEVCGREFVWTKGEQEFMNQLLEEGKIEKVITPKRCKACRVNKKKDRQARGFED